MTLPVVRIAKRSGGECTYCGDLAEALYRTTFAEQFVASVTDDICARCLAQFDPPEELLPPEMKSPESSDQLPRATDGGSLAENAPDVTPEADSSSSFGPRLARLLSRAIGRPVTWEFPGWLSIPTSYGVLLACGQLDETWRANIDPPELLSDGGFTTDLPSDCEDEAEVLATIIAALRGYEETVEDRAAAARRAFYTLNRQEEPTP